MSRIVTLTTGWSLVLIALVGCVDCARDGDVAAAVLFAILVVGIAAFTVEVDRRRGVVLRDDLRSWVEQVAPVTGETPDELADRAVSRLRAGFAEEASGR